MCYRKGMDNTNSSEPEHPLDEASRLYGGRERIAKALGVSVSAYGNWKARGVPYKQCIRIETLVPRVTRRRLRPLDYADMWPDLAEGKNDLAGKRGVVRSHDSSFPASEDCGHARIEERRI